MADKGMTMQGLSAMGVGVLALIVVFAIIPLVGSELDTAVTLPAAGAGSQWNSSVNLDIPTGVSFWESVGGILTVAGIMVIIGGVLRTIQGLRA